MNVKFTFTDHTSFSKVPFLNPIFQYVDHHLCYLIGLQDISLSTCHKFQQHRDNLCLSGIFMANHTERTQSIPYPVFYQVGILSCYAGHNEFYKLPNFFDFADFLVAKLSTSKWHESTAPLIKNPPFPWPQQINKEWMIYIKNKKKLCLLFATWQVRQQIDLKFSCLNLRKIWLRMIGSMLLRLWVTFIMELGCLEFGGHNNEILNFIISMSCSNGHPNCLEIAERVREHNNIHFSQLLQDFESIASV